MRSFVFFGLCAGLLTLTSCEGAFDPYKRPGNWSLTGAPTETIAQQAANKSDLIQGQSEPGTNGIVAVAGVQKAMTNGTGTGLQTVVTPTSPGGTE